jgi:hypothetical protein
MQKPRRFTVPLSPETHKRFKLLCVASDVQMTDFLTELLEKELDRRDQKAAKTTREVRA